MKILSVRNIESVKVDSRSNPIEIIDVTFRNLFFKQTRRYFRVGGMNCYDLSTGKYSLEMTCGVYNFLDAQEFEQKRQSILDGEKRLLEEVQAKVKKS